MNSSRDEVSVTLPAGVDVDCTPLRAAVTGNDFRLYHPSPAIAEILPNWISRAAPRFAVAVGVCGLLAMALFAFVLGVQEPTMLFMIVPPAIFIAVGCLVPKLLFHVQFDRDADRLTYRRFGRTQSRHLSEIAAVQLLAAEIWPLRQPRLFDPHSRHFRISFQVNVVFQEGERWCLSHVGYRELSERMAIELARFLSVPLIVRVDELLQKLAEMNAQEERSLATRWGRFQSLLAGLFAGGSATSGVGFMAGAIYGACVNVMPFPFGQIEGAMACAIWGGVLGLILGFPLGVLPGAIAGWFRPELLARLRRRRGIDVAAAVGATSDRVDLPKKV